MKRLRLLVPAACACLLLLAGCGKNDSSSSTSSASSDSGASSFPGMEADLARTVKAQADFYKTAALADLPTDLKWEDGADLPEFSSPDAKEGGTFHYYITDFPRTLRTIGPDATGGIRPYILDYVAVPWVNPHPNVPGAIYPGLAKEWAVDPKTKTVYFKIDPDARWSDGVPITTDDLVFSYYYMRSPLLNEPWYNDFYSKTYSSITVYDKLTFAITLAEWKPDAVLRAGNNVPIPRHAYGDFGPDWIQKYQWRPVPTTGAYEVVEKNIEKGRAVTITKVKNWWAHDKRFWRHRFNPDRYRLEVIRDPDKAFEAFARGDLDMFPLGQPKYWYESLPDTHPAVAAGYIVKTKFFNQIPRPDYGLWINSSKPQLSDNQVRVGLQYATNFDLVCAQYYRGDAVRLETRSDGYGWDMNPDVRARHFDPVRARAEFAKAGYDHQGPDGILQNAQGQRLSFTVTTYSSALRDLLSILQQEALKAGVEYKPEILDSTTGWKKVQEKNHEIALIALSRSVEMYPRYWEMYHGTNAYEDAYLGPDGKPVDKYSLGTPNPHPEKIRVQTNNMTETFIPALDKLIEQYDATTDMPTIKTLASQMEKIIYDDASWVNGWALPFHRTGYWRYVKWPKDFNVMQSRSAEEMFLHWIDEDAKKETEDARKSGKTFPPQILTFDQYK